MIHESEKIDTSVPITDINAINNATEGDGNIEITEVLPNSAPEGADNNNNNDDDDEEQINTEGNRDNLVQSLPRINKNGFIRDSIYINRENNEVELIREKPKAIPESWILDDSVDSVPNLDTRTQINQEDHFASQDEVWLKVHEALNQRFELQTASVAILAVGGSGSGKSYTMFGSSVNETEKGIIPRFAEYAFQPHIKAENITTNNNSPVNELKEEEPSPKHNFPKLEGGWGASFIQMSAYIIHGEQIIDLLNPSSMYSYEGNIFYSDALGPLISPVAKPVVTSYKQCLDLLRLALQTSAIVLANSIDYHNTSHFIINMRVVNVPADRIISITFGELATFACAESLPASIDRLTGTSLFNHSTRLLKASVKKNVMFGGDAHTAPESDKYTPAVLTFLLQNELYKNPDCFIIGCLRGHTAAFTDNFACLDFINRLDSSSEVSVGTAKRTSSLKQVIVNIEKEILKTSKDIVIELQKELDLELELIEAEKIKKNKSKNILNKPDGSKTKVNSEHHAKGELYAGKAIRDREFPPHGKHRNIPVSQLLENKISLLIKLKQGLLFMSSNDKIKINDEFNYLEWPISLEEEAEEKKIQEDTEAKEEEEKKLRKKPLLKKETLHNVKKLKTKRSKDIFEFLKLWISINGIYILSSGVKINHDFVSDDVDRESNALIDDIDPEDEEIIIDNNNKKSRFSFKQPKIDDTVKKKNKKKKPKKEPLLWTEDVPVIPYFTLTSPASHTSSYGRIYCTKKYTVVRGSKLNLVEFKVFECDRYHPNFTFQTKLFNPQNFCLGSKEDYDNNRVKKTSEELAFLMELSSFLECDGPVLDAMLSETETPSQEVDVLTKAFLTDRDDLSVCRLYGTALEPLHCVFFVRNDVVKLIPTRLSSLASDTGVSPCLVNGQLVTHDIILKDNDCIQLGYSRFLTLHMPKKPVNNHHESINIDENHIRSLSSWERCMILTYYQELWESIYDCEKKRRHVAHLAVSRELTQVMKYKKRSEIESMKEFEPPEEDILTLLNEISILDKVKFCVSIGTSHAATWLASELRRGVHFEFNFAMVAPNDTKHKGRTIVIRDTKLSIAIQSRGKNKNKNIAMFCGTVLARNTSGEGSWFWSPDVLQERFFLMGSMYDDFTGVWCNNDPMWLDKLYPPILDTFKDTLLDELIGVGFVYLDCLQYLLDADDRVPIITFTGKPAGFVKINIRCWIDEVETIPSYLSVDKESLLSDFMNRTLLMDFYFDSLQGLPPNHCASTYLYFKFFCHSIGYKTGRHSGISTNPYCGNTIRIEQRITKDFIEFIKIGSVELEVFGKRKVPLNPPITTISQVFIGEPDEIFIIEENEDEELAEDDDDGEDGGVGDKMNLTNQLESLQQQLSETLELLDGTEQKLQRAKKLTEGAIQEKEAIIAEKEQMKKTQQKLNSDFQAVTLELEKLKTSGKKSSCILS